jgi:hypothetical protein
MDFPFRQELPEVVRLFEGNNILENDIDMPSSEPVADTLIIDGAALVNSKPPNVSATFDDIYS